MCGFVGYIDKRKKYKKTIKEMGDMISHRGPDDEKYYTDDNISLAFRRLSFLDLKNGSQPMQNEDESLVIVYNGEIYNFMDIKEDLVKKGHIFKTNSDTEVIIHGYEEYKEKIVDKLRGMFAFVIWDKNKKELFGARDPFGIKPFYYTIQDDTFIFGSEIKSFLKHPNFKKELNKDALKPYLTFQYSVLEETFFKDVYRLKPGHLFKYKDSKIKIKKYFNYTYEEKKIEFDKLVDNLDKNIRKSVDIHRISDDNVKVGSFLSGGIDSSYVVSILKPDETFSVGFDFEKFNETNYAKELSDILGIQNKRKLINADEFFDALDKVQYYSDEPHANLSAVPLYFLSKLARQDVKAVLSGEGADELYGGYESYFETNSFKKYKKIPFVFRRGIKNIVKHLPYFKGQGFLIKGGSKLEEYYVGEAFIMDDKEANNVLTDNYKSNISFMDITKPYYDEVKDKSDLIKKQYIDMNLWLPNDILLKADKMTMANSLELRVPFLDKELFKESLTIKDDYKLANNTTKYVLRKASYKAVPEEWAKRPKKGFPVPFSIWIREEKYYKKVKKMFNDKMTKEFFDTNIINKLLDDHYNNVSNNGRKIYTIYSFLIWYKKYFTEL